MAGGNEIKSAIGNWKSAMILSGWEAVFFWGFSVAAILAGLLTVMARNAVHSALFLISTLLSVAALCVLLGAEFIAGVQILVYVGGVMVLFLFVMMLVNVGAEERGTTNIFNNSRQVGAGLIFCFLLVFGLLYAVGAGWQGLEEREKKKGVEAIAEQRLAQQHELATAATGTSKSTTATGRVSGSLYRYTPFPFGIARVLLLVAL